MVGGAISPNRTFHHKIDSANLANLAWTHSGEQLKAYHRRHLGCDNAYYSLDVFHVNRLDRFGFVGFSSTFLKSCHGLESVIQIVRHALVFDVLAEDLFVSAGVLIPV